jgi:hypothetical protein
LIPKHGGDANGKKWGIQFFPNITRRKRAVDKLGGGEKPLNTRKNPGKAGRG